MKFRELKLPKELSKRKKLQLYKCWLLEPLQKGAPIREIDINFDRDRYALTEEKALEYELNKLGRQEAISFIFGSVDMVDIDEESAAPAKDTDIRKCFVVILQVTLQNGCMDEDIIVPPLGVDDNDVRVDPCYDQDALLLTATVRDRIAEMTCKNYTVRDIYVSIRDDHIVITHLKMDEVVINDAVTGSEPKSE